MRTVLRHHGQQGFSAIELVVTLVILGVIFAAGLPAFTRSLRTSRVKDAAEQMASTIRLTRTRAVTESVPYLITWSTLGNTYTVVKDLDNDQVADAGEPQEGPFKLSAGVTVRNHPSHPFSGNRIALRPTGSAGEAGSLQFVNDKGQQVRLDLTKPSAMCEVIFEK